MNEEKPRKKHSKSTIEKMKIARRARTKQPRSGQSKKNQSLYQELLVDYKDKPEALEWIEKNKQFMNGGIEQSKEFGILTEYSTMYITHYEFALGNILYSPE